MPYNTGALLEEHLRAVGEDIIAKGAEAIKYQLRGNRWLAIQAWQKGRNKTTWEETRWANDDGRPLLDKEERFWTAEQKAAQQARFNALDAAYEKAKIFHGVT